MTIRGVIIFLFLLVISRSLSAQVTDSVLYVDTSSLIGKKIVDSAAMRKAKAETIPQTAAHSGYIINGKVVDANTSEGVPFSTIVFGKSGVGPAADPDGNFIFKLDKLPADSLIIKAI